MSNYQNVIEEATQQEIKEGTTAVGKVIADSIVEVCNEYLVIPEKRLKRMSYKRFMTKMVERTLDKLWELGGGDEVQMLTHEEIESVRDIAANDLIPTMLCAGVDKLVADEVLNAETD